MARMSQALKRFASDRRGNFAILTGAMISMLAVGAGFGINTAQLMNTKSALQNSLDAAVASTARDLTTGVISEADARASVEAFLAANGSGSFARQGATLDQLVVDRTAKTVEATAIANVALAFPLFGTDPTRTVGATTAAIYSDRKIEVVMMLDITGSMGGSKIRDLRTAASNAVDTLLGGQAQKTGRVRVALVPYADAVNTGTLSHTVYIEKNKNADSEPPKLDDPKLAANGKGGSHCATEREGMHQFSDVGPDTAMVNQDYRLQKDGFCPASALMPLTTDATALKTRIAGFAASGYTGGQIGVQWSWYMLSPQWASVLPEASRPAPHDPKKIAKYAILMTDGEFNTAYANVKDGANINGQGSKSRENAERLCREMKAQGIEIFTVGFMLKENAAKVVMSQCASPDSGSVKHYFEVSTGAELDQAYQTIASNIETLALTK